MRGAGDGYGFLRPSSPRKGEKRGSCPGDRLTSPVRALFDRAAAGESAGALPAARGVSQSVALHLGATRNG